MPRTHKAREVMRIAKAKRAHALERVELRQATVPRISAAGATSAPLKTPDPEVERMVREFKERKK